jgi:hypothetical protein
MPKLYHILGRNDVEKLSTILEDNNAQTQTILVSNDYSFNVFYVNTKKNKITLKDNSTIRQEDVFDINIFKIIEIFSQIKEFSKLIFKVSLRVPTTVEKMLKKKNKCWNHDAILSIIHKNTNCYNKMEFCFEYNEYESHGKSSIKSNDIRKKMQTMHFCDEFVTYNEEKLCNKYLNKNFYKNLIEKVFQYSCAVLNNSCMLSKILYFSNYNGSNIELDTNIFNLLIEYKTKNSINLSDFLDEMAIRDPRTEKVFSSEKKFCEYIFKKYKIQINKKIIDFDTFSQLVVILDIKDTSNIRLAIYKNIYCDVMKKIDEASKMIISLLMNNNKKKFSVPTMIKDFVQHDVWNMKESDIPRLMLDRIPKNDDLLVDIMIDRFLDIDCSEYMINKFDKRITHLKNLNKFCNNLEDSEISDIDIDAHSKSSNASNLEDSDSEDSIEPKPRKKLSALSKTLSNSKKICL